MGKAAGLLPSWYWPEGVQRYLSAPRVALYELAVGRWARRYGSDPALAAGEQVHTFRELDALCGTVAATCASRFPEGRGRVALAVHDPASFAPLLLGLLRADATVLLVDAQASDGLARMMADFQPGLVIGERSVPAAGDTQRADPAEFLTAEPGLPPRPSGPAALDPTRPSIALPGRDGLAWHSQSSVLSGAMAFAVFTQLEQSSRLLVSRPPASWEGLIGLLGPLQGGGMAIAAGPSDPASLRDSLRRHSPTVLWMAGAAATELLEGSPGLAEQMRSAPPLIYLTVTAAFPGRLRKALRRHLRAHVLTIYGYPECGPIAASHASWYLDEAVGIPMTGAGILALNPRSGEPAELPWPVLSHAGIGVQTEALATNARVGIASEAAKVEAGWYPTGDLGVLDANGMLFLSR
jgi:acyl-CoA synthetase (AMP-forming)/AMP-acid ligase II